MFAHNNSGSTYLDRNRRPETVAIIKEHPPAAEAATKLYQLSTWCKRGLAAISIASVVEKALYNMTPQALRGQQSRDRCRTHTEAATAVTAPLIQVQQPS
jgi:hypothetical protein